MTVAIHHEENDPGAEPSHSCFLIHLLWPVRRLLLAGEAETETETGDAAGQGFGLAVPARDVLKVRSGLQALADEALIAGRFDFGTPWILDREAA